MAKLTPLAGYCLIEPLDEQETTASGLVMPEKAKEKPAKGRVIATGAPIVHWETTPINIKGREEDCPVKRGDIVCFYRWGTQSIKEGQKEYLLVKFQDLQGVYEK